MSGVSTQAELSVAAEPHTARPSLLRHAYWTVPLHIVLPIALWWLMRYDREMAMSVFVGIHAAFPLFLLVTIRWWWSRMGELLWLLFINHLVTFVVLGFIPW